MSAQRGLRHSSGFSLIEVLITMLILGIGLLGLAGLQAQAFNAEVESFSRSQALIMLNDMADRIAANRVEAKKGSSSAYNTGTTQFGVPYTPAAACSSLPSTTSIEMAAKDICEWSEALKGATETVGGSKVGQLTNVRGCITFQAATAGPPAQPDRFRVILAWQGRSGAGSLASDLTSSPCVAAITPAGMQRAVSITVPFAALGA